MQKCFFDEYDVFTQKLRGTAHDKSPGKSGLVTTAHGLRIACLGGIYDPAVYNSSEAAPVSREIYTMLFSHELFLLGLWITLLLQAVR